MQIQEEYDLNIYVDEINIFDAPGVIFRSAEITEAICSPVPICKLELQVPLGWFDGRAIVDGTLLRFEIKDESQLLYENLKFRLFNINKIDIDQQFAQLTMEGLLDFYAGYQQHNDLNIYATSANVFRNVAKTFNLEAEIDDTNDEQLWVAAENNLYQFLAQTARHGWADETSAMFWCMDRHKILLYKNLTSLFRTRSTTIGKFVQLFRPDSTKKVYGYTKANGAISAGYENLINQGYGGEDHYFDLLSYDWKSVSARKVVAESNLINISKELSNGLAQSWYPFDVGNFHKNYWLAKKQNERILSTYSTYVNVATSYFMPYRLGQIVNFEYTDSQDQDNKIKAMSGTFAICAIKIMMNTRAITCNLQLVMQGLNGLADRETY